MARSKKKKKGLSFGKLVIILLIIFAILFFAANILMSHYMNFNEAYKPDETEGIRLTIPSGSTTTRIAEILEENGIIESAKTFKLKSKFNGMDGTYQAGDYKLSPSMTMDEIVYALQHAVRETKRFTIPEGLTMQQIAAKLVADGMIESEEAFYAAAEESYDYWFLDGKGSGLPDGTGKVSAKANRLEGFLFPNTYDVYIDATPYDIINRMLKGFDEVYTQEMRAKAKEMGLTTNEVVNIAALIEEETKVAEERPIVASVIYNRLDIGMKLQLDCTVLYARGEWKDRVLYSDLEIQSPYNTYYCSGLPAGPTACPGKASLEAALNPADTNYIYYVAKNDGSGGHNFAENAAQFQEYKNQYLKTLN